MLQLRLLLHAIFLALTRISVQTQTPVPIHSRVIHRIPSPTTIRIHTLISTLTLVPSRTPP